MKDGEDTDDGEEEETQSKAHALEKTQGLKGIIDGEGGSVVVDLYKLGTIHLFILIELLFINWAYLSWRFNSTHYYSCIPYSHVQWLIYVFRDIKYSPVHGHFELLYILHSKPAK